MNNIQCVTGSYIHQVIINCWQSWDNQSSAIFPSSLALTHTFFNIISTYLPVLIIGNINKPGGADTEEIRDW